MRIKKTSETTPTTSQVVNTQSNSTIDSYSCDYINNNVGKEVYSTEEIKIGTWIDGKPLYRKVLSTDLFNNGQRISCSANNDYSYLFGGTDTYKVHKLYGYVEWDDFQTPLPTARNLGNC